MILEQFVPDKYIKSYKDLDLQGLKDKGIKLLIVDIDNTIASENESRPSKEAISFFNNATNVGLEVVLISNNKHERVKPFAKALKLPYYHFALKPLKHTYNKVLSNYNYNISEIAVLGDQLITDILGANRMKIYSILQDPLTDKDNKYASVNRKVENEILKKLRKNKMFIKGEYYD